MRACGLDFGTSNSAIGVITNRQPVLAPVEGDEALIPSAIFFDFEEQRTRFGRDAIDTYIAGQEGRLMRALKSILGSPLIDESTAVESKRMPLTAPLSSLIALEWLNLNSVRGTSAKPLSHLARLKTLNIGSTLISDLQPIATFTELESVDVRDSRVTDLAPLVRNRALADLSIDGKQLASLPSVANLPHLARLTLIQRGSVDLSNVPS